MCDTMVAPGSVTADGSVVFAKNSDRQPNEPLVTIRIPRKQHPEGSRVKCTYMAVDQAEETFEVVLLKPSWIWGAEMGFNEFGLNIGNEAVFTKEEYGEPRLLGMDMLRIALERCRTSDEALNTLVDLLERCGQGGNCGYKKNFTYHNSFLMADPRSAWLLETAGEYWAAEKVSGPRNISNRLTIGSRFDRCHRELVKHAVDRKWCRSEKDFHFARCYSNHLPTRLSRSAERSAAVKRVLESEAGRITPGTMRRILRTHEEKIEGKQFSRHSLKSVCMHGGFLYGDHTTGSYVASLGEKRHTYLITGSSTPCLAVFKPYWLTEGETFTFSEDQADRAVAYWRKRELLHRCVLENRVPDLNGYLAERDRLEQETDRMIASLDAAGHDQGRLKEIMDNAALAAEALLNKTLDAASARRGKIGGNLYFKNYWKRQTASLYA
jgi:secernin